MPVAADQADRVLCLAASAAQQRSLENGRLGKQIAAIHAETDGVYGSPKVRDELLQLGFRAGRHRVARLMRELGLKGCPKKRYRITTQSDHGFRVAPNTLEREFTADRPDQRWAADITYIRTAEGWLYLAVVMDLFSKAIVGWSMSERITRDIVLKALLMALWRRKPNAGLLHHSDRLNPSSTPVGTSRPCSPSMGSNVL